MIPFSMVSGWNASSVQLGARLPVPLSPVFCLVLFFVCACLSLTLVSVFVLLSFRGWPRI